MSSWIKLYRKFIDWEWYQDGPASRVFLHLLLTANIEDKNWRGITIKRGQTATGRKALAKALKLSEKQIRTALDKLKRTNEVAIKTANRYSIITICKFDDYQEVLIEEGQQKGQEQGQQRATTKEKKEEKKIEKSSKKEKETLEFPENLDYPKFRKKWEDWISYRREMGFKTAIGTQQRNLSTVNRLSDGDVKTAVLIIQQSIDQNYQGLFALKNNQSVNGQKGYTPRHGVRDLDFDDVKSTKIKIKQQ